MRDVAVDSIRFWMDGKQSHPDVFRKTNEQLGFFEGSTALELDYQWSCPPLGRHIVQVTYLRADQWSVISAPLRFEILPPTTPEIIAIGIDEQAPRPISEFHSDRASGKVKLKLAGVYPGNRVAIELNGKQLESVVLDQQCCAVLNLKTLVPSGRYKLSVRTEAETDCGLTSEPSRPVWIDYYEHESQISQDNLITNKDLKLKIDTVLIPPLMATTPVEYYIAKSKECASCGKKACHCTSLQENPQSPRSVNGKSSNVSMGEAVSPPLHASVNAEPAIPVNVSTSSVLQETSTVQDTDVRIKSSETQLEIEVQNAMDRKATAKEKRLKAYAEWVQTQRMLNSASDSFSRAESQHAAIHKELEGAISVHASANKAANMKRAAAASERAIYRNDVQVHGRGDETKAKTAEREMYDAEKDAQAAGLVVSNLQTKLREADRHLKNDARCMKTRSNGAEIEKRITDNARLRKMPR
ncbi:MAG: hypothetical protein R3C05_10640 [Pirellulaceae bacterium]